VLRSSIGTMSDEQLTALDWPEGSGIRAGHRRTHDAAEEPPAHRAISPREVEVLKLIATDRTTAQVARDLCITDDGNHHIHHIHAKIGRRAARWRRSTG
jgi:DNA-binding CsgD family transcriptional regulator